KKRARAEFFADYGKDTPNPGVVVRLLRCYLHSVPRFFLAYEDVVLRGLGLALDGDSCDGMIRRLLRQVIDLELIWILLEVNLLIRRVHASRSRLGHQAAHLHISAGPIVDMHEQRVT